MLKTCEVCGADFEGVLCPDCQIADEDAWIQRHEVIAADPQAHEAHELAIAIFTLQHPEQYTEQVIGWARMVLERHIASQKNREC